MCHLIFITILALFFPPCLSLSSPHTLPLSVCLSLLPFLPLVHVSDSLLSQPLLPSSCGAWCFSISSSSLEESSPEQTVPRSCIPPQPPRPLATHPHPSSLHHHHRKDQPLPAFMPVADLTDIHMTDSENSDFAEHSEMSDLGKHGLGEHSAQSGGFTPIHPDRVWPRHSRGEALLFFLDHSFMSVGLSRLQQVMLFLQAGGRR